MLVPISATAATGYSNYGIALNRQKRRRKKLAQKNQKPGNDRAWLNGLK
jgi:hypothetical protein